MNPHQRKVKLSYLVGYFKLFFDETFIGESAHGYMASYFEIFEKW